MIQTLAGIFKYSKFLTQKYAFYIFNFFMEFKAKGIKQTNIFAPLLNIRISPPTATGVILRVSRTCVTCKVIRGRI